MTCEEISDLLPAYVLGILEPDEVEAIETHLRAGDEHNEELIDLRATVFAMDRYQEDAVPSPSASLAERIQAIAEPQPQAPARLIPPPRRRLFSMPLFRAAAAAAVLVLVFVAGLLAGGAFTGERESVAFALQGEDGAFMEVSGTTGEGSVMVTMAGLERLSGASYQVWAIRDDGWHSIGVCNTNAQGGWVGDFDFSLDGGEQVALTIEPQGGSDGPTSEPILRSGR